jgi:hypothetical protein
MAYQDIPMVSSSDPYSQGSLMMAHRSIHMAHRSRRCITMVHRSHQPSLAVRVNSMTMVLAQLQTIVFT